MERRQTASALSTSYMGFRWLAQRFYLYGTGRFGTFGLEAKCYPAAIPIAMSGSVFVVLFLPSYCSVICPSAWTTSNLANPRTHPSR